MEAGLIYADRYRIEQPIGSGGVGLVYRAFDLKLQMPVALKCLRAEWAENHRIRRRFMREARAITRLQHPNIVRVFDYGEADDVPYIAMEFIDGTPLAEMRQEPMALPVLLELVDQVLAALAYIHARRIIHRDVKPENIMVVTEGGLTAKLLDFGFARVEEDQDARLSQTRFETFGTPQYMAPEQASGKGGIGPPTDLYALGVVLYEFLAGKPPFTGTHGMAIALKHLMEPVPPLKARRGISLPHGLEAVVMRLLKKAPAERFPNAADLRRALLPFRGMESDEDATLPGSALADAAAHIVRIAGEAASGARGEATASGLFRAISQVSHGPQSATVSQVGLLAPDTARRRGNGQPLVGREGDLVELWGRVRSVCETGQGRVVLLGAESGMGRRDVVEWLQEQVAEGGWMRVVQAEAGAGARLGQSSLAALLEDLFESLPPDREEARARIGELLLRWSASTYEATTSEAIAGALGGFLRADGPSSSEREAITIRRACEAIRLAARERPVLLTVLAADQADLQSQTFLWHLARSLTESTFPALVLLTWSEAAGAPVAEARRLLAAFERFGPPVVETCRLQPLSSASTTALLRTMADVTDAASAALARAARGNPLLARELLMLQQQEGQLQRVGRTWDLSAFAEPDRWPGTLAEVLSLRALLTVSSLPDGAFLRAVLDRTAVLGEAFDFALVLDFLTRLLGDAPRVERAIEALLKAQILTDERGKDSDRLRFAHPALCTSLAGASTLSRDPVVHREAAAALVAVFGDEARRHAVPIADHFIAAGEPILAGQHYVAAADLARDEGRTADARASLERADALLGQSRGREAAHKRAEVWLALCELELAQSDETRAQPLAERAVRWAEDNGDALVGARASLLVGDVARRRGDVVGAVRAYAQAAKRFEALGDGHGLGRCLLGQAFAESSLRHFDVAGGLFLEARRHLEAAHDHHGVARATRGCAEVALRQGDYLAAGRHLEMAREAFIKAADQRGEVACDWLLGETCRLLQLNERATDHYHAARRGYVNLGNPAGIARCDLHLARLLAAAGQWTEAASRFGQAVRSLEELGDHAGATAAHAEWIRAALSHRAFRYALDPLKVRLATAVEARDRKGETTVRAQLAWVAGELGDAETCRNELRAAVSLDRAHDLGDPDLAAAFEGLAAVFRRYGHPHRAEPLEVRAKRMRADLAAKA